MPNWVFSTLTATGNPADIDKLVTQLNQPFTMYHKDYISLDTADGDRRVQMDKNGMPIYQRVATQYSNPVFAFWNIIKPTDLDAYYGEETHKEEIYKNGEFDKDAFSREFARSLAEDNDWWHWNVRNWGTKWDVAVADNTKWVETTMERTRTDLVTYHFQTAWDIPQNAIILLSEQNPNLVFDLSYEEEQGWGGMVEIKNGQVTILDEYDIPASHQDYVDRDEECWACAMYQGDAEDFLFDDCPKEDLDAELASVIQLS